MELLSIEGQEARDFLHRITSSDFRFLKPGEFTTGTLLQANGKLILYFKAVCTGKDSFILVCPKISEENSALDAFERLHFRENLKIGILENYAYARIVSNDEAPASQSPDRFILLENRWNKNLWYPERAWKTDYGMIIPKDKLPSEKSDLDVFRIASGSPGPLSEILTSVLPLEAHLEDAVHENKGCYPGQEVIERIRSMGESPRKLVAFRGKGSMPQVPQPLILCEEKKTEAGTLTSAVENPWEEGWLGLGFVKKLYLKENTDLCLKSDSSKLERKAV